MLSVPRWGCCGSCRHATGALPREGGFGDLGGLARLNLPLRVVVPAIRLRSSPPSFPTTGSAFPHFKLARVPHLLRYMLTSYLPR